MLGVLIAMHIAHQSPPWWAWALLATSYLLYPQMVWLVNRRSSQPVQHEIMFMRLDSLMCGVWTAALHFPLWIGFTLFIGVVVNLTLFHGMRGLIQSTLSWLLGAGIAVMFTGLYFQPETEWRVTWTALVALSLYLLVTALDNFQRSMKLHATRTLLKAKEQDLHAQLQKINGLQTLLKEQALRDPLTGLYNRYRLDEVLAREIARCSRSQLPLSVVLIDVDHFKRINDRLGHQVGDDVLRQLARRLQENTRASDWCFRYGGEEFLLVCPDTSIEEARGKADSLRSGLAEHPLVCGKDPLLVTFSAGVACFPEHGTDQDSLIGSADEALYRAKDQGRDRVLAIAEVTPTQDCAIGPGQAAPASSSHSARAS